MSEETIKTEKSEVVETTAHKMPETTVKSNNNNKTLIIVGIVVAVLFLCLCSCMIVLFASMKSAENSQPDYFPPSEFEDGYEEPMGSDGAIGEPVNLDAFYAKGQTATGNDWTVKVIDASQAGDTVIVKMEVTNTSSEARTLSSILSLDMKNVNVAYGDYDTGYSQDFFTETDRGLIDQEVPAGATFQAEMPFRVDDSTALEDLYLEFTPDFMGTETFNFELE